MEPLSWAAPPVSQSANVPAAPVPGYSVRSSADPQIVWPADVVSGMSWMIPPPPEAVLVAAKCVPA